MNYVTSYCRFGDFGNNFQTNGVSNSIFEYFGTIIVERERERERERVIK
jgi:hypothetical protein